MSAPEGIEVSPVTVELEPGFFSETTDRGAKQRWKDGDRVRFKDGLPQKIGGWEDAEVGGAEPLVIPHGVPRRYHEWSSLDGQHWIAEGTNSKLYLISGNQRYDITPIRRTILLSGGNVFLIGASTSIMTVTDTAHGAQTGDFVRFDRAVTVGDLEVSGEYEITAIVNSNQYRISAGFSITGGSSSGPVVAEYDINAGGVSNARARGWGTCAYNDSTYGTPRDPACSNIISRLRIWSLDNFGEDLIASPRGGAIYHWDRTLGPTTRAVLLPDAPQTNEHVLMSQTGGRIICLGAFDATANTPDPMFIIAGEEESLTVFNEPGPGEDENDVYIERASKGSRLITGVSTRSGVVVFTDTAVGILLPDPDQIFNLVILAEGNSVVGPNAVIEINGTIYAMGQKKFLKFDGVLNEMPCPVWGFVFDNADGATTPGFNEAQGDKVYAWHNTDYNEIWWQYTSADETENDRAVIYNYAENLWFYLSIERTAALPKGASYGVPVAADASAALFLHETGTNDDTAPMNEYIESFDSEMGDGKNVLHVGSVVPDMKRHIGTLELRLKSKNRPRKVTYVTKGPYEFEPTDSEVGVRAQGRQMAFRIGSSELDTDWRMGHFTYYVQPDGEGR